MGRMVSWSRTARTHVVDANMQRPLKQQCSGQSTAARNQVFLILPLPSKSSLPSPPGIKPRLAPVDIRPVMFFADAPWMLPSQPTTQPKRGALQSMSTTRKVMPLSSSSGAWLPFQLKPAHSMPCGWYASSVLLLAIDSMLPPSVQRR